MVGSIPQTKKTQRLNFFGPNRPEAYLLGGRLENEPSRRGVVALDLDLDPPFDPRIAGRPAARQSAKKKLADKKPTRCYF